MVEFFAPWCPACVTFLPHLETLKEANADLPLAVVKVFFIMIMIIMVTMVVNPTCIFESYKCVENTAVGNGVMSVVLVMMKKMTKKFRSTQTTTRS